MKSIHYLQHVFFVLPFLTDRTLAEQLSIQNYLSQTAHPCIKDCIYYPYDSDDDITDVMVCAEPVDNECFCTTALDYASAAEDWFNKCASARCAAGDVQRDISSMRIIYASYCMAAGFTQPIVSKWYTSEAQTTTVDSTESEATSEPSLTEETTEPVTSRVLTVVTETSDPQPPGNGAPRSTGELTLLGTVVVAAVLLGLL